MRRSAIGLVAVVAVAAAVTGVSSAGPRAFVEMRAGDGLDVAGTKVGCLVVAGAVACYQATAEGKEVTALPRTYGAVIYTDGRAAAFRVDAKGAPKILFARKPQGARDRVRRFLRARVGQVFRLEGTRLDCAIVRSGAGAGKPTVYCSQDDATGPIPGTYAILVSDEVAAVGKIGPSRRTTIVFTRKQP